MKTVEVICDKCNKTVLKPKGEYDRRVRLGKNKFYCNNYCSFLASKNLIKNVEYCRKHPQEIYLRTVNSDGYKLFLKKCFDKRVSYEHSVGLKSALRHAKQRAKQKALTDINYATDLDYNYIKDLWIQQKGICPYTKKVMNFDKKENPYRASLDRIDSNKGYLKNNVEFVCLSVNYAKSSFTRNEMIDFFSSSSYENLDYSI